MGSVLQISIRELDLIDEWGNPSSSYRFGSKLKGVIERAREHVAELLGASPREILFTNTAAEIPAAIEAVKRAVHALRL